MSRTEKVIKERKIIISIPHQQANWRKKVAPYEKSNLRHSVWQLFNTLVPFFLLWYGAYLCLSVSYWLTLALAIPAGGFLVRIFIIFHDCCHQSFFKNKRANAIVGYFTGVMTCCPYEQWKHTHSVHHATSSNLNKRGVGDVWTLTVDEYVALPFWKRMYYRIYRNPFVMFVIGPIYIFLIDYRFNRKRVSRKERFNTYLTNLGIVAAAGGISMLIGWQQFLLVQGPIFLISGAAGIWLFYVQHQFEGTYFENEEEWDYVKAALQGSSYYKLPKLLHWITGNIGFHHIHHLSPRVPNYYLPSVHAQSEQFQDVPSVTILSSLKALRYRLWSEKRKMFVGFGEIEQDAWENEQPVKKQKTS